MAKKFRAFLITKSTDRQKNSLVEMTTDDLMAGDVIIAVSHSTLNYKDGLALTGRAPVVRRFPMIPGIDLAGIILNSDHPRLEHGDRVLVNGFGLGETHYGGYSERARLRSDWLVRVPGRFSCADAMAIGTAGYTAMLAVLALEDAGAKPANGPVLVSGASGGVGSVAVALLSKLGYHVIASTGRIEEERYLKELGASEIIARDELAGPERPLARERWAAAIDSVGSTTLANILAATQWHGVVAACGLAGGMDLPATVAPFILRGVSLLGIDSAQMLMPRRVQAWERLARDLDMDKLSSMTRMIDLEEVEQAAGEILAGKVRGRLVVGIAA